MSLRIKNLAFSTPKHCSMTMQSEECLYLNSSCGILGCLVEPLNSCAWYLIDLCGRRNAKPMAYPELTRYYEPATTQKRDLTQIVTNTITTWIIALNRVYIVFTSRQPRELKSRIAKGLLHHPRILSTTLPASMHILEPHVKIACTHNSLGNVTGSISVGGTFAGRCMSIDMCTINSFYAFPLTKHTYQLTGHKVRKA